MPDIETLNGLGAAWAGTMARSLVGASALLGVLLLIWLPLRRRMSSQLACGLFLLVLVKACFPVTVEVPGALARLVPGSTAGEPVATTTVEPKPEVQPLHRPPANQGILPWSHSPRDVTASTVDPPDHAPATPPPVAIAPLVPPPSIPARAVSAGAPPGRPVLTVRAALMLAWAALTVVLPVRFAWVHARMSLRLRGAQRLDPGTLSIGYDELCKRCGFRRPIPLHVTPWVASPAVWGLWRPRLLVPPGLVEALAPESLRWVLLHELVHVRRGDTWVATFQRLVQIVHVFNPAVWVANRLIDVQREYACDDAALALMGDVPRRDCGAGFLAVIEYASARAAGACPAMGLFGSHTFLRRRLMRILDSHRPLQRRLSARAALGLGVLAVVVLPYVRARAQDEPKPPKAAPADRKSEGPKAEAPPVAVPPQAASRPATLREVEARVVGEDGKPLAGVAVEAKSYHEGYIDRLGTTDSEGRCRIAAPVGDPMFVLLGVAKDGFIPLNTYWEEKEIRESPTLSHTFRMIRGTRISLAVRDEQGRPIAGAKVVPWFMGKVGAASKERFYSGEAAARTTDAQGRWQADVLPAKTEPNDRLVFRLIHPDFASDRMGFTRGLAIDEARAGTGVLVMKAGLPVSGRVVDPAGKPVADAAVALGFSNSDGDCLLTRSDAEGRFRFAHVDAGGLPSLKLGVEAAGYAPAVKSVAVAADLPSQEFRLEPGTPLRGRVVDTEGKPLSGAIVKFDSSDATRHWNWKAETDADGRFSWPDGPASGQVAFNVSRPPFTRAMGRSVAAGAGDVTLTLHRALRLRGTVVDAETGKPIQKFTLIPGWGPDRPGGHVSWRRDASSKALTGGAYDEVGLFPDQGMTRSLRIEADGCAPDMLIGFRDDVGEVVHEFKLRKAPGISGVVRGPDGAPIKGAIVALVNGSVEPTIMNGKIEEFFRASGATVETGPDGRYQFRAQEKPSGIVVVADEGYARRTPEQVAASADIRVEPWGRVEGTCHAGKRPVAGQKIRLFVDATTASSTNYEFYEYESETDAQGRFVVERVIPGDAVASTATRQGTNRGAYGSMRSDSVEIKPGVTSKAAIGGRGRPVIGRLTVPGGNVLPLNFTKGEGNLGLQSGQAKMSLPKDFMTWEPERRRAYSFAWYVSPEGKASRRATRGNGLKIEADGSFRAEDVLPGSYELTVTLGKDRANASLDKTVVRAHAKRDVVVPEIPGGRTDEPLDLGAVVLTIDTLSYRSLEVGQAAPGFAIKTIDGKPLTLADYRGALRSARLLGDVVRPLFGGGAQPEGDVRRFREGPPLRDHQPEPR